MMQKDGKPINIYEELAYDITANTEVTLALAKQVVQWLDEGGLLDYDMLKEYYEDE